MVTMGISPSRKDPHGRAWNRTRDLMISSQKLWPLDHEAEIIHYCSPLELERVKPPPPLWPVNFHRFPCNNFSCIDPPVMDLKT
jgi:hypothetical protein